MQQQLITTKRVEIAVATVLSLWFLIALLIGASGLFYGVSAPTVGLTNGLLITLTLLSLLLLRPLRMWSMRVSLRWLVVYHAVRIVAGIGFLVLYQRGALPSDFALVAGWGDIMVGVAAVVVAGVALPITNRGRWWIVLLWNILGLYDILRVLSTALRLGSVDPAQVIVITAFPMSLLPTCIVPLVIVTHVLIFVRLWYMRIYSHV